VKSHEKVEVLPRTLGTWSLWLLVVNGLIGAGIFGLPSGAARLAGAYSPLVYVFCALLILPILLCFAELASYYRGTGGPVRYATDAFGRFVGFQSGWLFYVARVVSFAANSLLLIDSIGYFWPGANQGISRLMMLLVICGGFTMINVVGAVQSIRSLALLTVAKFTVLILLVVTGIWALGTELLPGNNNLSVFQSTVQLDFGAATLLLIYAFVGFESAVVPAGESCNPTKDMPRALIFGLFSVTLLYVLIQQVTMLTVSDLGATSTPLLDSAEALLGAAGVLILMLGIIASVGGNLVGAMFSTPRITYALALDDCLPSWFGKVHIHFKTPANSIMFYGVFAFLIAAFGSFLWLAAATILSRLLMYILTCAAVPVLRPRQDSTKIFILRGGYSLPLLGIAACLWLMLQVSLASAMLTGAFILLGSALYWLARNALVKKT
jgi:amino acid transporter